MPGKRKARPPLACRCLIRTAGWIVPRRVRSEWCAKWDSSLWSWWILFERGELTLRAYLQIVRHCWGAFADAFWLRFSKASMRHAVRGPAFVLFSAGAVLFVTAVLTHGFRFTRSLVEASLAVNHRLPPGAPFDIREDTLVSHAIPLVFALATGIVLVTIGRLSLRRCGWRYWSFLVSKTIGVVVIVPLLWIETGRALRAHIPHEGLRVLAGGLGLGFVFIIAFGCALVWVFADQRRRCPICLQLLAMPVTIGSWASVFEPAATELLCEDGHGSLCVADSEDGEPDRWIALDASWHDLFAAKPR